MAKKFKFKLVGLLKVREFKEKKIKVELGEILKDIEDVKNRINQDQLDIEDCYKAQEALLAQPTAGQMAQFYPQFIETKRQDQIAQRAILYSLDKKYAEKVKELALAKGEVKVLDNLKEKHQKIHKKQIDKKLQEAIDELTAAKKYKERSL